MTEAARPMPEPRPDTSGAVSMPQSLTTERTDVSLSQAAGSHDRVAVGPIERAQTTPQSTTESFPASNVAIPEPQGDSPEEPQGSTRTEIYSADSDTELGIVARAEAAVDNRDDNGTDVSEAAAAEETTSIDDTRTDDEQRAENADEGSSAEQTRTVKEERATTDQLPLIRHRDVSTGRYASVAEDVPDSSTTGKSENDTTTQDSVDVNTKQNQQTTVEDPDDDRNYVKELHAQGVDAREISEWTGLSRFEIRNIINGTDSQNAKPESAKPEKGRVDTTFIDRDAAQLEERNGVLYVRQRMESGAVVLTPANIATATENVRPERSAEELEAERQAHEAAVARVREEMMPDIPAASEIDTGSVGLDYIVHQQERFKELLEMEGDRKLLFHPASYGPGVGRPDKSGVFDKGLFGPTTDDALVLTTDPSDGLDKMPGDAEGQKFVYMVDADAALTHAAQSTRRIAVPEPDSDDAARARYSTYEVPGVDPTAVSAVLELDKYGNVAGYIRNQKYVGYQVNERLKTIKEMSDKKGPGNRERQAKNKQ